MRLVRVLGMVWVAWAVAAGAQGVVPTTTDAALAGMAGRAAVVFVGRVEAVTRQDAAGYVDVRFRVERAVKGCRVGVYGVREWAGLWRGGGGPRYVVGERRLMLLRARSASGLSAPVDGMAGTIPVGADGTVDLRWVVAGLGRGVAVVAKRGVNAEGLQVAGWAGPVVPMAASGSVGLEEVLGAVAGR